MAAGVIGKFMKGEGYGAIAPPPSDRKASGLQVFGCRHVDLWPG